MNRRITICVLSALALTFSAGAAYAAPEKTDAAGKDDVKYDYRKTPFYIMPQVSVNYTDNENAHFQDWYRMLAPGISLTMGKEFSPLWGWRASLSYKWNREAANFRDMNRDYDLFMFSNAELFGDITFDFSDLVHRSPDPRKWKVILFAGAGGGWAFGFGDRELNDVGEYDNTPSPVFAGRGGVNVAYNFNDRVGLTLEGAGYMLQDKYNGVTGMGRKFDVKSSLALGVIFYLGKRAELPAEEPSAPEIVPEEEPQPTVYNVVPVMAFITPEVEVKTRMTESRRAGLIFPVSKTELVPELGNNARELDGIRSSVDLVKNDKNLIIKSIQLHGYASPEGAYDNNSRLADGRAKAVREWLMAEYGLSEDAISIETTPEDWDGLKAWVDSCDLKEKAQILAIIDDPVLKPDQKEWRLKKLNGGSTYKILHENVFPGLRHTDYSIGYIVRPFDVEEGRKIIFTDPEMLSPDEMYQVASSFEKGSKNYERACVIAAETYPDNSALNLNAACVMLEKKDTASAATYLEKVDDCPQKTHAIGVIKALEGDYDAARELFKEAAAAGLAESEQMYRQLMQ